MSDLSTQYRIVTTGAGWIDKTPRGRLRFDGRDGASFLHALLTNDVQGLRPGQGAYALYLTPQGRVIADLRVHQRADHLLVDVPPGLAAPLVARFDQLIFAEDVRLADASTELGQLAVMGPAAAGALASAFGVEALTLGALPIWSHIDISGGFIARTDDVTLPSFDAFFPSAQAADVIGRLGAGGVVMMPDALRESLRIEAGRPVFGADVTEETIPLEAGLVDRAISLTKGCYVGQEVIVRVLHRGGGRVARLLVKLEFDPSVTEPPRVGTPLSVDGRDVGRVTSSAWSPVRDRGMALGYVRRELAEIGGHVTAGDGIAAEIVGMAG